MTPFDDLLPGDATQRNRRPAARHHADRPSHAGSLGSGLRDAWRAATARDVPTSHPDRCRPLHAHLEDIVTETATSMPPLNEWALARWEAARAEGKHDAQCEQGPNYYLCHCRKRERLELGPPEILGELIYQCPLCPECYREVAPDGDGGWDCSRCHAHFGDDLTFQYFDDDLGDEPLHGPHGRWLDLPEDHR